MLCCTLAVFSLNIFCPFGRFMKLLFITDPLENFAIYKDTTFSMMREAQQRGHSIAVCQPQEVMWVSGSVVTARVRDIVLTGQQSAWFSA